MPRVKRIRVSNIKLDGGNKIIGDKTWEVLGNNTLFLLENGGGKTSIIQLIHQVILPNHTIQKRDMKDSVQKGSTVHIAVEWMSDDDYHSEFITGFCFQNYGVKRSQNDPGYGYITYIIEYDHNEAIFLPRLPFVQNGKVSNLDELKTFFRKQKGVQIYDKNIEYQQVLEQYGILASEWKNIAKVNGAEAGVTEFFSRTATTESLIEKLFIPSLLENIFHTDLDQNAITEAFRKYKDRLLELPELERQLNDFKVVFKSSDEIINACRQYNLVLNELENAQRMLTRLYVTIKNDSQQNLNVINKLKKELVELEKVKKELQWKIDSYNVYLNQKEVVQVKRSFEEAVDLFETIKNEVKLIERKINDQNAARLYEDYKEYLSLNNQYNAQLETATLETKERFSKLEEKRILVSQQHQYLVNKKLNLEKELRTKQILNKDLQEKAENSMEEARKRREQISNQKSSLGSLIQRHDKELLELKQRFTTHWDQDIPTTLQSMGAKQDEKIERIDKVEKSIDQLGKKLDDLKQQILENKADLKTKKGVLEQIEKEFEYFSDEEMKLKNKTSAFLTIQVQDNLFEEKEMIQIKLDRTKRQIEEDITKLSMEMAHFGQIKNSIDQRGYHVHSELEGVKDYLVSKDIYVVLGVDWITRLAMSEEKKWELVRKNPLITFSVLIEESQVQKVRRTLEQYNKELTIPIVLLDKNKLHLQEEKEIVFPIEQSSFIFHRFNVRFKSEEWDKFVTELQDNIEEVSRDRNELRGKLRELQNYEHRLQGFWKVYMLHSRDVFNRKIEQLTNEINFFTAFEKTLVNGQREAEKEIQKLKDELVPLQEEKKEIEQHILLLQNFIDRYKDIKEKKLELNSLSETLVVVDGEIDVLSGNIDMYKKEIEKLNARLEGIRNLVRELNRDAKEYEFLMVDKEVETTEESYEGTKAIYRVLREEETADSQKIQVIQTTIKNYQRLLERSVEEIKKCGYSVEAFSKVVILFDKEMLEYLESEKITMKEQLEEERAKKDDLKSDYDGKMAVLNKLKENIYEKYKEFEEDTYEYTVNAEEEFRLFQSELALFEKNQNDVKLTLEKTLKQEERNITAIEELEVSKEWFIGIHNAEELNEEEWSKENPMNNVRVSKARIDEKRKELRDQNYKVREQIKSLKDDIRATGNTSLIQMTTDLTKILDNLKNDYDEIIASFVSLIERIEKYEESYEMQKKQSIEGRNQLIEMMYDRAELIYKNILEIPKSSQIEESGEIVSLFTMQWPKKEMEDIKHQLRIFIDDLLEKLVILQQKGTSPDELEDVFNNKANMLNILNCYADITRCRLKALKPRNVLLASNKEYFIWDDISGWSQGEKHAARMSMFIALNTHLRKKRFSKENSWKFLIVDNPFGEASADHVVKPMITLAEKTNTQLFCLTGIKEKSIQVEFKTVISNKYVLQRGVLVLNSEEQHKNQKATELESFFYAKQ